MGEPVVAAAAPAVARARVIDAGLGRIVGSLGDVSVDGAPDMMLGSWMLWGEVGP